MSKGKRKKARERAASAARPAGSDTPLYDTLVPLYQRYDYDQIVATNSKWLGGEYNERSIREINVMAANKAEPELRLLAAVAESDDTIAMLGLLDELTDPSLEAVRQHMKEMTS